MNNKISNGETIVISAATGGVVGGAIHLGTNRCGIYAFSATGGVSTTVALVGEFQVTKAAATGEAISVLDKVYAKATGGANVASATGTIPLGYASAAAATGAVLVNVILSGHD